MNSNIEKLYAIAGKDERLIIGLMSGTSLDGLDIALCRFSGSGLKTKVKVELFNTISYDYSVKEEIRQVFAKDIVNLQQLCLLNAWIGNFHAKLILETLASWKVKAEDVDLIASHGQTIFHAPKSLHKQDKFSNATLQIGDGDHLAVKTGIITLSDFRQKHVAAGGEGAPLAVYGDYLLFSQEGEDRIMLNIGGIANFTYLSSDLDPSKMFSTDIGPGNTLIDAFIRIHFPGKSYDENGSIAAAGTVSASLLQALKSDPFFNADIPKSTGPELFSIDFVKRAQEKSQTLELPPHDLVATLTKLSADGIADGIKKKFSARNYPVIYASGGGMHNSTLIAMIREALEGITIKNTEDPSVQPDAKEAVLFATLANECVAAESPSLGKQNKIPGVFMGKISFPH